MEYYGTVSGIFAQATRGSEPRCQAYIHEDDSHFIQVTTTYLNLQSALELASLKNCKVEVSYEESGGTNYLQRVRLFDR